MSLTATPSGELAVKDPDQPENEGAVVLELHDVSKVFPNGTAALRGVDMRVVAGTVHGLVGANGAGKSTLVKILAGAHSATAGWLQWRGQTQNWQRPRDASRSGIATIHQNVPLAPTLSVIENVFLNSSDVLRRSNEEARDYVERAVEDDPSLPDALAFRSIVLNRLGRTEEAA